MVIWMMVLALSLLGPQQAHGQSASATTASAPSVHTVTVGQGNFQYSPNVTFAEPGDIVSFLFYPTNHSVIRAAYGLPCIPYEDTGADLKGFSSGNFLIDSLKDPPSWNLTINDTNPIFFYCSALNSCISHGMVGVINPNSSVSLQKQSEAAVQAPYMLVPGEPFPVEGSPVPSLTAANTHTIFVPTTVPSSSASSSASALSSGGSSPSQTLSAGAIAGVSIAAVAVVILLVAAIWLFGRNRSLAANVQASQWRDVKHWSGDSARYGGASPATSPHQDNAHTWETPNPQPFRESYHAYQQGYSAGLAAVATSPQLMPAEPRIEELEAPHGRVPR